AGRLRVTLVRGRNLRGELLDAVVRSREALVEIAHGFVLGGLLESAGPVVQSGERSLLLHESRAEVRALLGDIGPKRQDLVFRSGGIARGHTQRVGERVETTCKVINLFGCACDAGVERPRGVTVGLLEGYGAVAEGGERPLVFGEERAHEATPVVDV